MNQKAESSLRCLVLLVGFMMSCSVVLVPLEDKFFKGRVETEVPQSFPILVLTRDEKSQPLHARIVRKKNLETFLSENPQHTYLVPQGQERDLNQELSRVPDPATGAPAFHASFVVKRLPDGKQSFKVEYDLYDDVTNVGWYEATDKDIFPSTTNPMATLAY